MVTLVSATLQCFLFCCRFIQQDTSSPRDFSLYLSTAPQKNIFFRHQKNWKAADLCALILYLWASSSGGDDGSPTYWLSPDRDHLHSEIPMLGTMLGSRPEPGHFFGLKRGKDELEDGSLPPGGGNLKRGFLREIKAAQKKYSFK